MLRSVTTKFRRAVVRATPPIRRSAVLQNAGPSCNAVYCGGNGSRVTQVAREGQFIIQQDQAAALSLKELLSQKDGAAPPSRTAREVTDETQHPPLKQSFIERAGSAPLKIEKAAETEWSTRCELAAAYRLADSFGWMEGVVNHFSVRVPGEPGSFLINAFGLGYEDVTASSLVKVDHEGNVLDAGSYAGTINQAGFVIHSALHEARPDAHAVMHTHEANVAAVSAMACGLTAVSQTALVLGKVAYHDFEGVAVDEDEKTRLVKDIGDASNLILRNHGVLTAGTSIAEAFTRLYYVHLAAEIQVKAMSSNGALHVPAEDVQDLVRNEQSFDVATNRALCDATFQAFKRKLDKINPGYDQ